MASDNPTATASAPPSDVSAPAPERRSWDGGPAVDPGRRQSIRFSLSMRLLAWTILFVMLAEVLIYVPSISRYRLVYLKEHMAAAHLATLALDAAPDHEVERGLEQMLLDHAGVLAIELSRPNAELMLGRIPPVDASFDLSEQTPPRLIAAAFDTLLQQGRRIIAVTGTPPQAEHRHDPMSVTIYLDEADLYEGMVDYSWRILTLSIVISLITAALLYFILQWSMVRPMRRITRNLVAFRQAPQDPRRIIPPSNRRDELGVLQRELSVMQGQVRAALAQKERLAALGTAVSKINHDLRNILSTTKLVSERLVRLPDPTVQKVAPMLTASVDRAVQLCTQTMDLARGDRAVPEREHFSLASLLDEVGNALGLDPHGAVAWHNQVAADIPVYADYQRLFRLFLNLGRNAQQALGDEGNITLRSSLQGGKLLVDLADDGPGLPEGARAHLFQAFAGSASGGGTGLGLATARDLARSHGGELRLLQTSAAGTTFQLELPLDDARPTGPRP